MPWVIIEILSPDDRMPAQLQRFRDYQEVGVRHVVLLDPENDISYRFEAGSLLQMPLTSLDLPSGAVPFETESLFHDLASRCAAG